jgi:hypothetical protein
MERGYFEDPGLKRSIILKWILKECNEVSWTGLIWVRIRTGVHLLLLRIWTSRLYKRSVTS